MQEYEQHGRWEGLRSFVIASAVLFLGLCLGGEITWPVALGSFLFLGVVAVLRVIYTRRRHQPPVKEEPLPQRLRAPTKELAAGAGLVIIEQLPDPLMVLDSSARIVLCNRAAAQLVGRNVVGKQVAAVLRNAALVSAVEDVRATGEWRGVDYTVPVPVERHFHAYVTPIDAEVRLDGGAQGEETRTERFLLIRLHDLTEAKRLEAMRVDFVANASHELKTPLASMTGFIDTLRGHARGDPEAQERFLGIMADQAARMRRLIDDLLSLSRIEMREHMRPRNKVNLTELVSDVVRHLQPLNEEMPIHIEAPADLPFVFGERDELAQVVQNFVENAFKYASSGERLDICLYPEKRNGKAVVNLDVRDYGPGIAREHLPRLTERFYRVDAAESRARGGTGLGLAIVKHILNRHQASLIIESELGKGTTFRVQLPVSD